MDQNKAFNISDQSDGLKISSSFVDQRNIRPNKTRDIGAEKLTDEELLDVYIGVNDEAALNEIVDRYADRIFRLSLCVTKKPNHADTVLQDVFVAIEKLDTNHKEPRFSKWAYSNASKKSLMHPTDEGIGNKRESVEDKATYDVAKAMIGAQKVRYGTLSQLESNNKEIVKVIAGSIYELSVLNRTTFHLKEEEGISIEEISVMIELSESTIKSNIHVARLFIFQKVSDYLNVRRENFASANCNAKPANYWNTEEGGV